MIGPWSPSPSMYAAAIEDLRALLSRLGRRDFRAFGYAAQLRSYRAALRG